jgi:hypothetical protein
MKLGEYIKALQELEKVHGPDIEHFVWPYDGQMHPVPSETPRLSCTPEQISEWRAANPGRKDWSPPYPCPIILTDEG